ncbi:hypothetical protein [Allocoleopsis sp.]|uniref:hypothetical protein n=1 Tax=Allocoleopsis sp. TaxID=3088169 RepID=UPI002FCFFCCA
MFNFKLTQKSIAILIFIGCLTIYLINDRTISSGDSIPNTILIFNLLENHTFNFDAFRESYFVELGVYYSFVESQNGHLTSVYPIGVAILTSPLYLIFYIFLKIFHISVNFNHESFEFYRIHFEKITAAITTAISVVFFYLASSFKFKRSVAFLSTFIFAFATNTWMISSQGLWQHGSSNLSVTIIIFCLIKANYINRKKPKIIILIIAGIFCGLLPIIRPTSTLFLVAVLLYSFTIYRWYSIFLILGMASGIPGCLWNFYYFGNFIGGYSSISVPLYSFTVKTFVEASLGILISPSRGIFVFSPIILYSFFGAYKVFQLRFYKDEKLIGIMILAALGLFFSYCFYIFWWAGYCYGPRFMTDILPVTCYLINYYIDDLSKPLNHFHTHRFIDKFKRLLFLLMVIISLFVQIVGAFGDKGLYWSIYPLKLEQYTSRLWHVKDNQIERHIQALFHQVFPPPVKDSKYINGLSGSIKQVTYNGNQPLSHNFSVVAQSQALLEAEVENTGSSQWFGYEAAVEKGEVRVRILFLNSKNEIKSKQYLYVSGTPKKFEKTKAIGSIVFPDQPGRYRIKFDLVSDQVYIFPKPPQDSVNELEIQVNPSKL